MIKAMESTADIQEHISQTKALLLEEGEKYLNLLDVTAGSSPLRSNFLLIFHREHFPPRV